MQSGRLTALPFLFSPRIIACRRDILAAAGCREPSPDWTLDDLLELTWKLRAHDPDCPVFSWSANPGQWLNFILCCGGTLFDPEAADPVRFDSPEALKGLRYHRQLRNDRQRETEKTHPFWESAVAIIERQSYGMHLKDREKEYIFLPMPGDRPEHNGISIQATELLSVRLDGIDRGLLRPLIRFLWSEAFQDHLAELKYGIPIRRSSEERSFAGNTAADAVFRQACGTLRSAYQLHDENLFSLVKKGMLKLFLESGSLERDIPAFADTVRQYIRYMGIFQEA